MLAMWFTTCSTFLSARAAPPPEIERAKYNNSWHVTVITHFGKECVNEGALDRVTLVGVGKDRVVERV